MTSTAILSSLNRVPVADTDTGIPRSQNSKADLSTTDDGKDTAVKPASPTDTKPSTNATVRRTTIDWETGSLVFRVIDEHSGRTVSQSPEEALLRLRAYARQNETTAVAVGNQDPQAPTPNRTKKTV